MKHYLLNHQPQKGLQAACAQQGQAPTCNARGKGRTPASPATLTKVILVLLTMFLLPSAAWGQTVTITKTITFDQEGDGNPVSGSDINNSTIPVSVSEEINGTTYSYNSLVNINNSGAIEQYSWSNAGAVFRVYNNATTELPDYFAIDIPGKYPQVPTKVEMKFKYVNAISDPEYPDDEYSAIIYVCDYTSGDNPDLRYKTTESNLDKTTNPLIFTAGDKPVTVKGETITGEGGTDRSGDPKSLWINISLDGNSDADTEDDQATFTITEVKITYETDSYDLSIAGVPVTGVNADNILGDNTVAFIGGALKLNGASISGGGIYTTLENLEIDLVNTNTIETGSGTTGQGTSTRNGIMSTKNGTLTFVTASGGSLEITSTASAIKGFQTINGYLETHVPYTIKSKNDNYPNQDLYRTCEIEGDSVAITWMKISDLETYPLWIGDYQVNANNKDHILGSGNTTVTFSPTSSPATLTLNNANYGPSVKGIVWSGGGNLKIQFSGNNIINTYNGGELNAGEGYCILGNSSSDLILSASDNARTLTLKPNSGDTPESYYSKAAISGFTNVSLDDDWGSYYTDNYTTANLKSLTAGKEVLIAKPYGLTVAGVKVTSANYEDILDGDNTGTVSFTPAQGKTPATLTLDGAKLEVSTNEGAAIESNLTDLTVYLVGENLVQAQAGNTTIETLYAFKGNGSNTTVTFATDVQNPGTIGGQLLEQYVSKDVTLAYQEGLGLSRQGDSFTIGVITYGITIGETIVTYFNKKDVFGDSKVSFKPATIGQDQASIPATLTLNGASIGQIKMTAAGDLTLHFVGENTITVENVSDIPIQGYNSSGTLEFSTSNNKTDVLTIVGIENTNRIVYSWSHAPSISATGYEADWAVVSTGATQNTHHITKNNKYDLWINGERFCDTNLAPYSVATFDPETSTLTYAHNDQTHVIYSGLPSLTIKMGNSQLNSIAFGSPNPTEQPITAKSGTLSIVKYSDDSSVEPEPFKLVGDGTNSVISGFTGVTYDDYLILEDGVSYNTESKQLENTSKEAAKSAVFVSATLEKPMMENFDGVLSIRNFNYYDPNPSIDDDDIQIGTIKYSIEYSDGSEGVTDALFNESNAPTLDKAAIVTAYVQLNGVTSESATGKYLEAKQDIFAMAIGDVVEGTDWFTPSVSNDEVTFFFDGSKSNGIFEEENEKLIAKKSGTGMVEVNYEGENILNNAPITLTINVGEKLSSYFDANNNYGTFYNTSETTYAVPEGMKAYVITGVNGDKVITTETTVLPPNTVVLMDKGEGKAFTYIPATSGSAPTGNLLKRATSDVAVNTSSKLFVLYNDEYVKATAGSPIPAGKNYLDLSGVTAAGTRGFYNIGDGEDGTTGISDVKSGEVDGEKWADGGWHDLQGRKFTTKPTKSGLYILNGKKVVIK